MSILLQIKLWFGDSNIREYWQLEGVMEQQLEENERLRTRNARLQAQVRDLKNGLDVVEERARNELGMTKKGETFYQVIDPDSE